MSNCPDCGGYNNPEELDPIYISYYVGGVVHELDTTIDLSECSCIRCNLCDVIVSDHVEPEWWTDQQFINHNRSEHSIESFNV